MEEGRRFEDNVSVHELMNLPQKELMAKIYIQTLKTNGATKLNCEKINVLEDTMKLKANNADVTDIRTELKDKIGWKLMTALFAFLVGVNLIFGLLQYFSGR